MKETLTDFGERQLDTLTKETMRRIEQMDREITHPFGQEELDEEEQVQKYIDFRLILTAAEAGDEQATQGMNDIREEFGLKALAEDILRVHPKFERRFKDGQT